MLALIHILKRQILALALALFSALCWTQPATAIVLYDTDFSLANTTAPGGTYANSGWAFQGEYGGFLGTMISSQYFITARHFGTQGSTFISRAAMNGSMDVTYTIDTSANGGQGYWDISGTDLRILRINESFSSYAQIYTGSAEAGKSMVTFGRGGPRGAAVDNFGPVQGWRHTGSDGVTRWGANTVDAVLPSGIGSLLIADFDAVSGQNEATLSSGDSGGGVFIQVSGQWYLAGINYGVDGFFDTNDTPGDNSEFNAALFSKDGYYMGDDSEGWDLQADDPSRLYMSRISGSATAINNIIASPVPEPGSAALLLLAGLTAIRRSRTSALAPQK